MTSATKRASSLKIFGPGLIEIFFYLPVLLAAAVYLLPSSVVWVWIVTLTLCYWLGSMLIGSKPQLRLIFRLMLAVVIGAMHACLTILLGVGELGIVAPVICGLLGSIVAARGMSAMLHGWTETFTNTRMLVGIMIYVAAQPIKLALVKEFADYNGVLIVCGIASVILFFFLTNERHLNNETVDTGKSPATLAFKRQNRLMMIIVVALISLIAMFRQIQQAIEHFFYSFIQKLMSWFNRPQENQPVEEPVGQPPQNMLPIDEQKPKAEWMIWLEQIVKIIAIVLVIAVVAIILFFVFRKLYQVTKALVAKLMLRGAESRKGESGFTDEVENLMTLTNLKEQMGKQLKKLLPRKREHGPEWNDLTSNAERIRFLYSNYVRADMKRGYTFHINLTPRETAEDLAKWTGTGKSKEEVDELIEVYETVRYGEKQPSDKQVASIKQKIEPKQL